MPNDINKDEQPDNGKAFTFAPGCSVYWGLRISPRLFGLLERQGMGKGRRYRRFYGVVLGNFQCGIWGWTLSEWPLDCDDRPAR